jgi:hypothetical protein
VAIDYFTKWIEAEALSSISADQVKSFIGGKLFAGLDYPNISSQTTERSLRVKR